VALGYTVSNLGIDQKLKMFPYVTNIESPSLTFKFSMSLASAFMWIFMSSSHTYFLPMSFIKVIPWCIRNINIHNDNNYCQKEKDFCLKEEIITSFALNTYFYSGNRGINETPITQTLGMLLSPIGDLSHTSILFYHYSYSGSAL
jgi:hypothetical protein